MAHTHHLLEQANFAFTDLVGLISDPKAKLYTRVVSGTVGHFPLHSIEPNDDVVISSLQTVSNGVKNGHQQLESFIASAKGRLFVVFDEAHHSPAPSYRNLILAIRERCPQMYLMGLTATPTYTEEKKRGCGFRRQDLVHCASGRALLVRRLGPHLALERPRHFPCHPSRASHLWCQHVLSQFPTHSPTPPQSRWFFLCLGPRYTIIKQSLALCP